MNDLFASIAGRGASYDRASELEPVPPFIPLPRGTPVYEAFPGTPPEWQPLPRIGDEAALDAELRRLREWVAPFLRELGPKPAPTRTAITLSEFDWKLLRSRDEEAHFAAAAEGGAGGWQRVKLPHYGPPTGPALAWYRTTFELPREWFAPGKTVWLCFGGADYKARVTLNGRCLGEHEGFFSPFELDATATARPGKNTLLVELWNDGICMGNHGEPDGDKLYAATGIGWDEPGSGWHHCPPGMGLWRPVAIELRPAVFLRDLWVRPLPGLETAELRAEVHNTLGRPVPVCLRLEVGPENFEGPLVLESDVPALPDAGLGTTFYRIPLSLPGARRWSPQAPWLYRATAHLATAETLTAETLTAEVAIPPDAATVVFGMRSFRVDETTTPKGRLFLNDTPVRLRGANTMGFEQMRVFHGDLDGLLHDLLLARACHMNFLRFTQRPVEREVYELCDRAGIMAQSDLPLFGYLRRTQFAEAVRQAAEMARHTRRHACNILLTFINEPFPLSWGDKTHRQLDRSELEGFFFAATAAIRVEDPDVAIKPVDGDYDPPAPFGLPDSHIYSLWYNGHGLPYGQLHQGAFPPTKKGWCFGCGEFGAEGLDPAGLMLRRYPAAWLPQPGEDPTAWSPSRICRAQTGDIQPLFFDRPSTLEAWCEASREHQRFATKELTEAFRRMDRLVSCAIHLFIDAWPAGWMKTIVDCERRPKPAYFALRDAYAPVLLSLRADRRFYHGGTRAECEAWICNDTPHPLHACEIRWRVETTTGSVLGGGAFSVTAPACAPMCAGLLRWQMPQLERRDTVTIRAALLDAAGRTLADAALSFEVFPPFSFTLPEQTTALIAGNTCRALELATDAGAPLSEAKKSPAPSDAAAIASGWPEDAATAAEWLAWVERGGILLLYDLEACELPLPGGLVTIKRLGHWPAVFASRATGHPIVEGFQPFDFRFWFDTRTNRMEPFLHSVVLAPEGWRGILASAHCGWGIPSVPAHAACELRHGAGLLRICQVQLTGRLAANPPAGLFFHRLLNVR